VIVGTAMTVDVEGRISLVVSTVLLMATALLAQ
jgi:hypothetical protein